jgi:hypothetical protein
MKIKNKDQALKALNALSSYYSNTVLGYTAINLVIADELQLPDTKKDCWNRLVQFIKSN